MGVYYELNEHIGMNPLKSCQLSSDTSLEYQQGLVGSKWPVQPQKWPKMANFKKYSHGCGVGTLNLSQESSDNQPLLVL